MSKQLKEHVRELLAVWQAKETGRRRLVNDDLVETVNRIVTRAIRRYASKQLGDGVEHGLHSDALMGLQEALQTFDDTKGSLFGHIRARVNNRVKDGLDAVNKGSIRPDDWLADPQMVEADDDARAKYPWPLPPKGTFEDKAVDEGLRPSSDGMDPRVVAAMHQLSDEEFLAVAITHFQSPEVTPEREVAAQLGWSPAKAHRRLASGEVRLRELLGESSAEVKQIGPSETSNKVEGESALPDQAA